MRCQGQAPARPPISDLPAVAVRIAGDRALYPVPGRAGRQLGPRPVEPGRTLGTLISGLQVAFDLGEVPIAEARAGFVAGTVSWRVVRVAQPVLVVGLLLVLAAPERIFDRRIHRFTCRFADETTGNRADSGADNGTDRSRHRARRSASCCAACRRAQTRAYGMRAGRLGDRVAVGIAVILVFGFHLVLLKWMGWVLLQRQ